jgi:hypothetical protein
MNKTQDIQDAITSALSDGPQTLDEILGMGLDDDPRLVMVALVHLGRAGQIRYPSCDASHNHGGACTVEAA